MPALLRQHIEPGFLRDLATYVFFTLAFLAATPVVMHWAVADQRRRCPVCLARLTLAVAMGSWSSLFDPATTELVCENGHRAPPLRSAGRAWTTRGAGGRGGDSVPLA